MEKLAGVFVGSLTVFVQARSSGGHELVHLAELVGGISAAVSLALLVLSKAFGEASRLLQLGAAALLLLWIPGNSVMTVDPAGPFSASGNGYFGAWAALIFSWLLAVDFIPVLRPPVVEFVLVNGGVVVAMLTLSSFVVFCQTASIVTYRRGFHGKIGDDAISFQIVSIFACSGLSLLVMLLLHSRRVALRVQNHLGLIALFLLAWWGAGWFVATFDRPYQSCGNGFFGCWAALLAALSLVGATVGSWMRQRDQSESGTESVPPAMLGAALGSGIVFLALAYRGHAVWDTHSGYFRGRWREWEFALSGASAALCASLCIVMKVCPCRGPGCLLGCVFGLLLLCWAAGTGIMTFRGPFRETGNGYFGAWLALACVANLCHEYCQLVRDIAGAFGSQGHLLMWLFIASVTLLVQVIFDTSYALDRHRSISDGLIIAWTVAAGSLLICVAIMIGTSRSRENLPAVRMVLAVKLVLWALGVSTLTFRGPYGRTGNAYFALWGGLALSAVAFLRLR